MFHFRLNKMILIRLPICLQADLSFYCSQMPYTRFSWDPCQVWPATCVIGKVCTCKGGSSFRNVFTSLVREEIFLLFHRAFAFQKGNRKPQHLWKRCVYLLGALGPVKGPFCPLLRSWSKSFVVNSWVWEKTYSQWFSFWLCTVVEWANEPYISYVGISSRQWKLWWHELCF